MKRVYEPPSAKDGMRILVERLWPRAMTKEKAAIDHWLKEVAPTPELRKWYGHVPEKWPEFRTRYLKELQANSDAVSSLEDFCNGGPVTLIYSARDEQRNSAVVLLEYLLKSRG